MELESTRIKAEQQLKLKNEELSHLKNLLKIAITEKTEAQALYKNLLKIATTVAPPYSAVSSISDEQEPITNHGFSSSDCEESIVSSPVPENPFPADQDFGFPVKGLPENGRFLEAVMKAGPLLQNLMVAGAMPLWRHPPPAVDVRRIPPPPVVAAPVVSYLLDKKRGFCEGSECCTETKYQRIRIN
ncbi:hypothetical protein CTI12_AA019050 [Artemisia annua]|uniref:Uncharacterized protein n=1 Tax=Artemisia annua TaxID=35608 RepID=A0A2U1Q7R8_ARTAN|nr:hypothetical protein CTI12_AA019050 [Artemisia annua]